MAKSTERSTSGRRPATGRRSGPAPESPGSPFSPAPVTEAGRPELPAYVSNGLIGLRVLDIPILPGLCMVSGSVGKHPIIGIEASANPPYPLAGDIAINRVFLAIAPQQAEFVSQAYDFSCGELTSRFRFHADGVTADVEVLTFCSRDRPTLAVQELSVRVDAPCELTLRALIEPYRVRGTVTAKTLDQPGFHGDRIDGYLLWSALGNLSQVGYALTTELAGDPGAERRVKNWGENSPIATDYLLEARPGRTYRLRQLVSVVPNELHHNPDHQAARLVAEAKAAGFDVVRDANRAEWAELWQGRVVIDADDDRWQRLADAAFFYLNSSVHRSAPASTSIFGLAQWLDYHYYHGLVMWDIETFSLPPLLLLQPSAAHAALEYRTHSAPAARANAKQHGRRGLQFSWESGPLHGEESMPVPGLAAMYEDHGSLDIALAFAQFAHVAGDARFERYEAAPILFGVADWITSRVEARGGRYHVRRALGVAERQEPVDDPAYLVMAAKLVLREAIAVAERLGEAIDPDWRAVDAGLEPPRDPRTGAIVSHAGYRPSEEKGATPDPAAGLFPLWYPVDADTERATLRFFLDLAPGYIGEAMLSPHYGVWAAWAGDRDRSLRLFDDGYAKLVTGRFDQTMEHTRERYPDAPAAGPFFANLGGFLTDLLYGLPGVHPGPGDPASWAVRPVVLPAGWRRIEVERAWIRGRPARIVAEQGAERATVAIGRPTPAQGYPIPATSRM